MHASEDMVADLTEPIEISVVGDRIHAKLISGQWRQTVAVKFSDAQVAAHITTRLLGEVERDHCIVQLRRPYGHG